MNNIETGKEGERLGLEGSVNLLLLAGVVLFVLYSGFAADLPAPLGTEAYFMIYGVDIKIANLIRDLGLLGLAGLSLILDSERKPETQRLHLVPDHRGRDPVRRYLHDHHSRAGDPARWLWVRSAGSSTG